MNINKNKNIFNSIVYKNVQYIYNLYILRFFYILHKIKF